jgi:GTP-binding protein HflX
MKKLELEGSSPVILADTVGFIRDLPHQLVAAFHATLQETVESDLLLHVIDIADPHWPEAVTAVELVLNEIGVTDIPQLRVFNKIDRLQNPDVKSELDQEFDTVFVSAKTSEGLDALRERIATQLYGRIINESIELTAKDARLRAQLYAAGAVQEEKLTDSGGWTLNIRLSQEEKQRLFKERA